MSSAERIPHSGNSCKGYRLRRTKWGVDLLLASAQIRMAPEFMKARGIVGLVLSPSQRFEETNLDFLKDYAFVERCDVVDSFVRIRDITGIQHLTHVRRLHLHWRDKTILDFTRFPRLEACTLTWQPGVKTVLQCRTLSDLNLHNYRGRDLTGLSELDRLEKLELVGGSMTSLQGIEKLKKLRELELHYVTKLGSLRGIRVLSELKLLYVSHCKRIGRIDEVAHLKNLQVLHLWDNGEIASLQPIAGLTKLRQCTLAGETTVMDGDMRPLVRTPPLENTGFPNRRHYSHRHEYTDDGKDILIAQERKPGKKHK